MYYITSGAIRSISLSRHRIRQTLHSPKEKEVISTSTRIFCDRFRLQMVTGDGSGMRCLHCGNTLSAFKKLTDGDFCSTEHRDKFYTEQQRLIIERLKHSAARFHRLRRGGFGEVARVVEVQPPAKMATFLSAIPDARDQSPCLQFIPQVAPDLVATDPPEWRLAFAAEQYLSPRIPDLPWPRYNPGLLSCDSYELVEAGSETVSPGPVRLPFKASFSLDFPLDTTNSNETHSGFRSQ